MNEGNKIEKVVAQGINEAIKSETDIIDYLLGQFPDELQSRLIHEIDDFDDARAIEYLTTKLINRRFALRDATERDLPKGIEIITEFPKAIAQRITNSRERGEDAELGHGKNAEVIRSSRGAGTCYKVLYLDRARILFSTAAREALLQYRASTLLAQHSEVAQVPNVLRYVDHSDLRAIHMSEVDGVSMEKIFEHAANLPDGFDVEVFITKLREAIEILNEAGIFHRDLINNPSNVMVDKEGNPWIIDFGSAAQSINPGVDSRIYQVSSGAPRILATDLAGIERLRIRLVHYLHGRG